MFSGIIQSKEHVPQIVYERLKVELELVAKKHGILILPAGFEWIKEPEQSNDAIVICEYCGQWAARKTNCKHCGAPV